jgi:hypothetical protein
MMELFVPNQLLMGEVQDIHGNLVMDLIMMECLKGVTEQNVIIVKCEDLLLIQNVTGGTTMLVVVYVRLTVLMIW